MEMSKPITIPVETVGQAYLEILRARGIKYFFGIAAPTSGRSSTAWRNLPPRKKRIRSRSLFRMNSSRSAWLRATP